MKKTVLCILLFVVFVSLVIVSVILANSNEKTLIITTIPKSYCYVNGYSEKLEFPVTLYLNRTDTSLIDINSIDSTYLTNEEQMIKVNCINIQEQTKKVYIKNKEYHTYTYYFEMPITVSDKYQLSIPKASLNIITSSLEVNVQIGSFTYSKVPYFGDSNGHLSIMNLKPVVNEVWDNKTLVAVVLGLRNNSNYVIEINNLDFLNQSISPAYNDIRYINKEVYPSDDLSTLLGYPYTVVEDETTTSFSYTIAPFSTLQLLIPLKYHEEIIVDRLGLQFEYNYQNTSTSFYYDDFIYFQALPLTLENLQLYTYENY